MGEYMGGIGLGDAMLLAQRGNGCMDGGNMWNNPFVYMVWMSMLNGGGWGGWGGNNAAAQGALTRADLTMGFNDQDTRAGIRGIQQGLCDGFYAVNTGMLNGFNGVTSAISNCCCETNRNIDAVRYENSRNTCDIVNAIHGEGEVTRALINANTMDALREKVNEKDRELQSAQFQLSQLSQNATIINALRPTPIPAYLTCSPFTSYGGNGCGCGCGGYAA